jgi:hypothetical protein
VGIAKCNGMSRIIITNHSEVLEDQDALMLVMNVMEGGRISNEGKQYCFLTVFYYGITGMEHQVVSDLTKTGDKFTVYDNKKSTE